MQREQILAALCGPHRIVVARVQRAPGHIPSIADTAILAVPPAPQEKVPPGAAPESLVPWTDALRAVLADARWRAPAAPVFVAPPGGSVLLKAVRTPEIAPAQQAAVLRFECEQALPFALADLAWTAAPLGRDGGEREYAVAAVKRDTLAPLAAFIAGRRSGGAIVPLPLALPQLRSARETAAGNAAAELLIMHEETVSTLVARRGERTALRALLHPIDAGPPVPSSVEKLGIEIARAAGVLRRQLGAERFDTIEFASSGGSAELVRDFLAEKLGGPVAPFASGSACTIPAGLTAAEYAGVHALSAVAFTGESSALDLTPAEARAAACFRRGQPWWLGLAAVLALAPALWSGLLWQKIRTAKAESRALAAVIGPLRKQELQRQSRSAELEDVRRKLAILQATETARGRWSGLLAELEAHVTRVPGLRLDALEVLPETELPAPTVFSAGAPPPTSPHRLRLRLAGTIQNHPGDPTAGLRRAREFLAQLGDTAPFHGIERPRFDDSSPNQWRFEADLHVPGEKAP